MPQLSNGSTLYERQMERAADAARMDRTTAKAVTLGAARIIFRTQPQPHGSTKFVVMTWAERDGEILPRFRSEPRGQREIPTWEDFTRHKVFEGPLTAEQACASMENAIAVPLDALAMFKDARLTPSGAPTPELGL